MYIKPPTLGIRVFPPPEITCDAPSGHPLTCTTGNTTLPMDAVYNYVLLMSYVTYSINVSLDLSCNEHIVYILSVIHL